MVVELEFTKSDIWHIYTLARSVY